jgi:Restriction Enzyme Adenine Methylase Associated
MPLFEINGPSDLAAFHALHGGAELYESQIEDLVWSSPDELTGESLFPVARQPTVESGGKPDVVALDRNARVVVVEIKRDVERHQLSQCLEYAGWARKTNLDELAHMYHGGKDAFFADWQQFTESVAPTPIQPSPRLVLVARDFQRRTQSALDWLLAEGLPVLLIRVVIYEGEGGRLFLDVTGYTEPVPKAVGPDGSGPTPPPQGRKVQLADLLDAGLLHDGDELIWTRPRVGEEYRAFLTHDGGLRLDDGRVFSSPSRAAKEAAGVAAYDGWHAWRLGEKTLDVLRQDLASLEDADVQVGPAPAEPQ